jgi:hypothetical protein
MRDHGVEDYAALPDMDGTDVGVLREDDVACLQALGNYLVSADAWPRFGIWLLHKHFDPESGEVFVERSIRGRRKTETTPTAGAALSEQRLCATAIRFDDSASDVLGVIGMEYAEAADFDNVSPLSDDDEAVLAGIAELLAAHGKMGRFGVRLIRNPLDLSQHELLHETSDSVHRTLHCNVGDRDALLADKAIVQTAWRWKAIDGATAPTVMQDCTATCRIALVNGHDISHIYSIPDDFGND